MIEPTLWRELFYGHRCHLLRHDWPVVAEALSCLAGPTGLVQLAMGELERAAARDAWGLERYTAAAEAGVAAGWLAPLEWVRGELRTSLRVPEGV